MTTISKEKFLPPLWILTLLAVLSLSWLVMQLKELVVLLIVGYSISYVIDPVLEFLEKLKIARSRGVILIIFVMVGVVLAAIFSAVPVLLDDYERLSNNFPQYIRIVQDRFQGIIDKVRSILPPSTRNHLNSLSASSLTAQLFDGTHTAKILFALKEALLQGYSFTLTIINLFLLPFIVFYISVDFDGYHKIALSFIPNKYEKKVKELALEIHGHIASFISGQILIGIILTFFYLVGLGAIAKIELWFLLAFLSGFGNIIPYLGFVVGIVLSSIMALVTHEQISAVFWVWGVYIFVQSFEGLFITPKIMGEKVGLSPLSVILAIVAFGKIFGLIGIFLAIPIAAIVKVLSKHLHVWVVKKV